MKTTLFCIAAAAVVAQCHYIDKGDVTIDAAPNDIKATRDDALPYPWKGLDAGARKRRATSPQNQYPWLDLMEPLLQFTEPVHERVDQRDKRALPAKKEINKKTILPTLARQLENDPSLTTVTVNDDSPVTSYTVLEGDGETYPTMPMVVRAKIRPGHIRSYRDRPAGNVCIPPAVVSNLDLMGRLPGDHSGHLLAFTLGGPSEVWNFVPQLGRTNIGDYAREERIVRKFFKDNAKSDPWVDLLVVVVYSRVGRTMEKRPSGVSYYTMFYLGKKLVEQWFDILPNNPPPSIGPSNPTSTPGPDLLPCA